MNSRRPSTTPGERPVIESQPVPADVVRWDFINQWQVTDQSDDRRPVKSQVPNGSGPGAAQRSIARRAHQASYKEWSGDRHD